MKNNGKILIIVSSLSEGGAQRVASNLIMGLKRLYNVDILVNGSDRVDYPYCGTLYHLGLDACNNKQSIIYQVKVFIRRLLYLNKLKKHNDYIASISFLDSANIANILTKHTCKTIITMHSTMSARTEGLYRRFIIPITKYIYKYADSVIAVSKGVECDWKNKLGYKYNNITTIYNLFDRHYIITKGDEPLSTEEQAMYDSAMVISTCGRLCYAKGQWHLIRAVSRVVTTVPNLRLLILGNGEYENYLKSLCHDLNLDQNVIFMGFRTNPFKYISRSELFVMPSLYEGLCSALIEAVALGVPCISTNCNSGASEILAPELDMRIPVRNIYYGRYGILTPICDGIEYSAADPLTEEELMLSDAIVDLLKNDEFKRRYIANSVQAFDRFDTKEVLNKWQKIISQ